MKYSKILFGLAVFCGMGSFTSCDVNDEFYDELDNMEEAGFVKEVEYTLVEKDYEFFKSDEDELKNKIAKYKSFGADYTAIKYMPEFLADKYPYLDKGSVVTTTFKYHISSEYERSTDPEAYEMEAKDYDSLGTAKNEPGDKDAFSSKAVVDDYMPVFLERRFPIAVDGDSKLVKYTYKGGGDKYLDMQFDGTVWTVSSKEFGFDTDEAYRLSKEDYDSMGEGKDQPGDYDNFSSYVKPEDFLPAFMLGKYPDAKAGDVVTIKYYYYGYWNDKYIGFIKKNDQWVKNVTVSYDWATGEFELKTLSEDIEKVETFKFDGKVWAYVPPIKFVRVEATDDAIQYKGKDNTAALTDDDYELVGNGKYKNFDVRSGKDEETEEVRISKLTKVLKERYPDLKVGEVYFIEYKVYAGNGGIESQDSNDNGLWDIYLKAVEDN
ncbi:MAG: hypothetical protein ACEPOZ_18435 [Marinifilaceae bacterium]